MYCSNCGKEAQDKAAVCIHCGYALTSPLQDNTTLGCVLGVALGLIGLIIGLLCFNDKAYEKETFLKGWVKGFIISAIATVVIGAILAGAIYGFSRIEFDY